MLQRILVPTDGSPESEKAFPLAQQIAAAQDAEVLLTFVIEQPAMGVGWSGISDTSEAEAHLQTLAAWFSAAGVRTRTTVAQGPTAATLLDQERAENIDLLVMATHGRTGLARFTMGSVTDRMVREGSAPVLVVRRTADAASRLSSAIVGLDGSDFGEATLGLVAALAGRPLQAVTLFQVIADPADRGLAETYLQGVSHQLAGTGVAVTTAIDAGDPRKIIERATKGHDLAVLSTHGRGGFDRLRHGSVADYLVRYLEQPVLLVRATETPTRDPHGRVEPEAAELLETKLF